MKEQDRIYIDPKVIDFLVCRGERFEEVLDRALGLGSLCTNVKALQEVVYRYHLLGETARGYELATRLRRSVAVLPVREQELDTQELLLERYPTLAPRELLHAASMLCHGLKRIVCSPESRYREIEALEATSSLSRIGHGL